MSSFPPFITTVDKTAYLLNSIVPVAIGSMVINPTDNATVTVTGTGTTSLLPSAGYVSITQYIGNSFTQPSTPLFSVTGGKLVFSGLDSTRKYVMTADGYLDCSHSANNATVGVVFTLTKSGVTSYTPRVVHARLPNSGDIGNISGCGIIGSKASSVYLTSGDSFGVVLASSTSGTVSITSSNITFTLYTIVE